MDPVAAIEGGHQQIMIALTLWMMFSMPAMTCAADASRRMSLVPMKSTTCVTPAWERTSRSSRSRPGMLSGGGERLARVMVLPPMPSFTIDLRPPSLDDSSPEGRSGRTETQSSQRSCASSVEQVPSVIESPKATMALVERGESTSIDLSQYIDVVLPVKGVRVSSAVESPEPAAVR